MSKLEVGSGRSEMDIADGAIKGVVTITKGESPYVFVTAVDLAAARVVQVTLTKYQARALAKYLTEAAE